MTVDEAIAIVKTKSAGRTRYEGQPDYLDEVLVTEIERLRDQLAAERHAHEATIKHANEIIDWHQ